MIQVLHKHTHGFTHIRKAFFVLSLTERIPWLYISTCYEVMISVLAQEAHGKTGLVLVGTFGIHQYSGTVLLSISKSSYYCC